MADGKRLNVDLSFNADTSGARQAIRDLQNDLTKLSQTGLKNAASSFSLDKDLLKASQAAAQLRVDLQSAFNVKTGNIDLVKFNQSMKQAGMSAQQYRQSLQALGPAGTEAFAKLSQAIATSDAPLTRANSKLNEFATVLKNTARWQISSSVLHGFMSTLSQAFSYAQRLNESLNNIQIVTGQSAEQMAQFASTANKAAQSLSTTTRSYTDAALIFFQQGLGEKEVKERTEAVIKMSNVTKDSAQEVSSYMTAIWNNFDDGTKSLEHYADVITALGATTASSSAEIAAGLEKFASIGKTIGLSYDYATSALATIVANTRQSAETVGNGLRTIFSRLQGLNLGETLEDGVDLNKYSKALQTVGVSITDASGNLRDMDSILDDLAGKWETLSQAQQTALAQTVGGVRQYTTLISLMNNWGDMSKNLNTAQSADGSLQNQADIYAQSWEAAQKRVQSSAEAIYSSLINDDFFIAINNGFAGFLGQIENIIEGLGGLKGVLATLTPIVTALFRDQINSGLRNTIESIKALTPSGKANLEAKKQEFTNELTKDLYDQSTPGSSAMADQYKNMAGLQNMYVQNVNKMTEAGKQQAQQLLQNQQILQKHVEETGKSADNAQREADAISMSVNARINSKLKNNAPDAKELREAGSKLAENAKNQGFMQAAAAAGARIKIEVDPNSEETLDKQLADIKKKLALFYQAAHDSGNVDINSEGMETFKTALEALGDEVLNEKASFESLQSAMDAVISSQDEIGLADVSEFQDLAEIAGFDHGEAASMGSDILDSNLQSGQELFNLEAAAVQAGESTENLKEQMEDLSNVKLDLASGITASISALTAVASLINGINGLVNVWGDNTKSVGEKILTTITTIIPIVGALTAAFAGQNGELLKQTGVLALNSVAKLLNGTATATETASETGNTAARTGNTASVAANTAANLKNAASHLLTAIAAKTAGGGFISAGISAFTSGLAAQAGWWPLVVIMLAVTAAIAAVVGVCALVASGVKALIDAYNADAIAAEKAAETARSLANAYDEAKSKYDAMIQTMDKYKSARAALDSLTEGTEEYNAALSEANELGLQLINSTSGLQRGTDYNWENGQLIISDAAMDRVRQQESERVAQARAASLTGNAEAARAKAQADKTAFIRSDDASLWATMGAGAASGAAIGGLSGGGIFSGIGALIGGLIGGVGGLVTGIVGNNTGNAKQSAQIDALTEKYRQMGAQAFDAAELEALGIDSANQAYINSLKKVVEATVNAEEQMHNAARMAAQEILSTNEDYQRLDSEDKNRLGAASGRLYEQAQSVAYDKYLAQAESRGWFNTGTAESKAAWEKYANMQGISSLNGYKVTNYKGNGANSSVEYEYIDENGERQKREVTAQQMAAELAAAEAAEQLGQSTEYLMAEFDRLENSASKTDKALSDFLAGDMKSSSMSEFNALRGTLGDNASAKDVRSYLAQNFGDGKGALTDAEAKKYGYETADAMVEAFQEQYNNAMQAWDSIELPGGMGEWSENLSLGAAQQLENTIKDLNLGPAGEAAGQTFVAGLNKMLEDVDPEDQAAALNQLMMIDWSDWDAMAQAEAILKQFGVDINLDSEYWQNFTEQMRIAARAVPDFSKLKSDLNSISKILGGLKFGDAIKDDDYQTLIAYQSDWAEFFVMQADGTRKFIGNAEEMAQATRDMALAHKELLETYSVAANNEAVASFFNNSSNKDLTDSSKAAFEALLADESNGLMDALKALGYDEESIANALADPEKFKAMFEALRQVTDTSYLDQIDKEFEEMYASTAKTATELGEMLESGAISQETYQKSLILMAGSYSSCTDELEAYREALANGTPEQQEAARVALEAAVDFERLADASQKAYSQAMKGRESLSEENLKFLKENNPELWSMYFTASDTEWANASREIYRNWLDERMSMYAEDTVEYRMAYQQRKAIDEEEYATLQKKATEAYDAIQKKRDEVISASDKAMSTLQSALGSTDQMSFSEIEKLREDLIAAGVAAERVDEILNNINNADAGSAEQIKAQMIAATEAALGQLGANAATRDEYEVFTNLKNSGELTQQINEAIDAADSDIDGSINYDTNLDDVSSEIKLVKYNNDGTITFSKTGITGEVTQSILTYTVQDGSITFTTVDGTQVTSAIDSYTIQNGSITFTTVDGSQITSKIDSYKIQTDGSITFTTVNGDQVVSEIAQYTVQSNGSITFTTVDGSQITDTINGIKFQENGSVTFSTVNGGKTVTAGVETAIGAANKDVTIVAAGGDTFTASVTGFVQNADGSVSVSMKNNEDGTSITSEITDAVQLADGSILVKMADGSTIVTDATTAVGACVGYMGVSIKSDSSTTVQEALSKMSFTVTATVKLKTNQAQAAIEELNKRLVSKLSDAELREYARVSTMSVQEMMDTVNTTKRDDGWWSWLTGQDGKISWSTGDQATMSGLVSNIMSMDPSEIQQLIENGTLPQIVEALQTAINNGDEQTKAIAQNLMDGLKIGIENADVDWDSAVASTGVSIISAFKNSLGIHSPSALTKALAPYLFAGLNEGIAEGAAAWQCPPGVQGLGAIIATAFHDGLTEAFTGTEDDLADALGSFGDDYLLNNRYLTDKNLSGSQSAIMDKAIEAVIKNNGWGNLETALAEHRDEFYRLLQEEFNKEYNEVSSNVAKTWATIKDIWKQGLEAIYAEETQTAQKVCDLWEKTFKAIAKARQGLMDGKSIMESMFDDPESMAAMVQTWMDQGMSYGDAMRKLLDPNASVDYEPWDPEVYRQSGDQQFLNYANGQYQDTTLEEMRANATNHFTEMGTETILGAIKDVFTSAKLAEMAAATDPETKALVEELIAQGILERDGDALSLVSDQQLVSEDGKVIPAVIEAMVDQVMAPYETQSDVNGLLANVGVMQERAGYRMADRAQSEGEYYINSQQKKLDIVDKAREALLGGKDLSTVLNAEEQKALLEVTGASDLTAVSLGDLDTATTTLSATMVQAAEQIAIAMGMLQRGEATGFSFDPETGAVMVSGHGDEFTGDYTEATYTAANQARETARAEAEAGAQADWNAAYGRALSQNGGNQVAAVDAADAAVAAIIDAAGETAYQAALEAGDRYMQVNSDSGEPAANTGSTIENATNADLEARNKLIQQYAESVDMAVDEFEDYAEILKDANILTEEAFDDTGKLKGEYAEYVQTLAAMERGFKTAQTNGDKLVKTLKETRKNTADWTKNAKPLRNMYGDILGLTGAMKDKLSPAFLESTENMKLAQQAAAGNEKAMDQLQVAYLKDYVASCGFDMSRWDTDVQKLAEDIASFDFAGIEVGATIDDSDFLAKCNDLINMCASTATEASNMLSTMGVTATIVEHTAPVPPKTTTVTTQNGFYEWPDGNGGLTKVPLSATIEETDGGQVYKWYTIEGAKYNGKGVTHGGSSTPTGGGGGGGGSRERRNLAHSKEKPERYHRINEQIEDLTKAYEKLNKEEERAWGPQKIKLMQQEADLIKKQADAIRRKIDETKAYAALDKQRAQNEGWRFDENGVVINYEEHFEELRQQYNKGIEWYNSLSGAQQEAQDKIWAATEDGEGGFYSSYEDYLKKTYFDKPKELLEQWEETRDQLADLGIEFNSQMDQLHDNVLAQIQTKLDTTIEINDVELEVLDYKLKLIQDDAYKAADSIAYYSSKMDASKNKLDAYKESVNDLLKAYNQNWNVDKLLSGELTLEELVNAGMEADDIEIIKTAISGIISSMEEINSAMEDTYATMDDAFQTFNSDLDRFIATIDHASTVTQTYRNILDLTGRSMSGLTTNMIKSLNEMGVAQAQSKLEASKTKLQTVQTEYDVAYDAYLKAQTNYEAGLLSASALAAAKEAYENAEDNVHSAQEDFVSSWEAALQAAADAFQNTMEAVIKDIGDSMVNGLAGGLAEFQDQFSKLNEQDKDYVDDYEKIYQLTKLSRELGNKIDNSTNVRAQKELLAYQKEINRILQSDQELSQYDIDYMRKKYDLKVAELALEEAQNAKSQVSMRRDADGNYNYIYTADDDAVAKAEDEYATKLYEMQKANDEYIENISGQMANLSSQMLQEIAAIDTTIYDTEESYQAEVTRITEHYQTQMSYYSSEMDKVIDNNKDLYEQDWVKFNQMTGYKISTAENYVTKFNQTALSQASGFETLEEYYAAFGNALHGGNPDDPTSDSLIGQVVAAFIKMKEQMQAANTTAGGETGTLADMILGNVSDLTHEAEEAADKMTQKSEEIVQAVEDIGQEVDTMATKYANAMQTMTATTNGLLDALSDFLMLYGSVDGISIDEGILTWIQARKQQNPGSASGVTPVGMSSGGYTGNWGDSSGKLAVLHAKELVLNSEDTQNILASVDFVRQIASAIDLNALTSAGGLGALVASAAITQREALQQEVHIEASFPNVTDKNQIEEAFTDIINLASQYANRQ